MLEKSYEKSINRSIQARSYERLSKNVSGDFEIEIQEKTSKAEVVMENPEDEKDQQLEEDASPVKVRSHGR